jgi:nitroimidazol reductase NimA-like FMN-containing flavoprotein (pyridoxamine 5'-phosphate oxidase superfamily)
MAESDTPAPASHDHIESLERDECIRRLTAHGVGRIGVASHGRIGIFPVNYVVDEDNVVVQVRRDGELDAATRGTFVAIEIDHADSMNHEGWSVLVQGRCTHVTDPDDLETLAHVPLLPWGGSDRDLYLRVAMESVSGRQIHHRAV